MLHSIETAFSKIRGRCLGPVIRPEGPAPEGAKKLSPEFTLGSPGLGHALCEPRHRLEASGVWTFTEGLSARKSLPRRG
jgi:hypothetical protein